MRAYSYIANTTIQQKKKHQPRGDCLPSPLPSLSFSLIPFFPKLSVLLLRALEEGSLGKPPLTFSLAPPPNASWWEKNWPKSFALAGRDLFVFNYRTPGGIACRPDRQGEGWGEERRGETQTTGARWEEEEEARGERRDPEEDEAVGPGRGHSLRCFGGGAPPRGRGPAAGPPADREDLR
jgi:hypothetical protein